MKPPKTHPFTVITNPFLFQSMPRVMEYIAQTQLYALPNFLKYAKQYENKASS